MSFFSTTFGKIVKSRTVWGATGLGVMTVLPTIAPIVPANTKASAIIGLLLAIYTIYGRIMAKQPLGPVVDDTIAKTVNAVNAFHQTGEVPAAPATMSQAQMQLSMVKAEVKGTK